MPEDYGLIPNNILQRYIFGTIVSGDTIEEYNSPAFLQSILMYFLNIKPSLFDAAYYFGNVKLGPRSYWLKVYK